MMRVAMIGTGIIAKTNGSALQALPDVEIVALSNRTTAKAEALAATLQLNCPIYGDYKAMLLEAKPDAVVINLAHELHPLCFADCARAGVSVMIEKPLASTYAECQQMMELAEKYRIKATVCQTQRYNAVYEAATCFLNEHNPGRLLSINDNIHINYFWEGRPAWQLSQEQSGGGIALNYGVHQLDRVHYFLRQRTVKFQAEYLVAKPGYEIYSSYTMMGVGDGGTPYAITCTGYSGPTVNETRLVFEQGILQANLVGNSIQPCGLFYGDHTSSDFVAIPVELSNDQMYVRQFRSAIDYLSGKTDEAPVSLAWAAEMVRLVESGFNR